MHEMTYLFICSSIILDSRPILQLDLPAFPRPTTPRIRSLLAFKTSLHGCRPTKSTMIRLKHVLFLFSYLPFNHITFSLSHGQLFHEHADLALWLRFLEAASSTKPLSTPELCEQQRSESCCAEQPRAIQRPAACAAPRRCT